VASRKLPPIAGGPPCSSRVAQRVANDVAEHVDRRGGERRLGAGDGLGQGLRRHIDDGERERVGADLRVGVPAGDVGPGALARRPAHGPADQPEPEDRDAHR
jgi:hypothetical protein